MNASSLGVFDRITIGVDVSATTRDRGENRDTGLSTTDPAPKLAPRVISGDGDGGPRVWKRNLPERSRDTRARDGAGRVRRSAGTSDRSPRPRPRERDRALAGCAGDEAAGAGRQPASQVRNVSTATPRAAAHSAWERLSRVRTSLRTEAHLAIGHDNAIGPPLAGSEWTAMRFAVRGYPLKCARNCKKYFSW